ncbi:MAG: HAMP domain-containing protein [Polyangiaceae bacterium]|nr:HAMP domain-containing protein [Polyangiaceae bacterium]
MGRETSRSEPAAPPSDAPSGGASAPAPGGQRARRTVAGRLLASYLFVLVAFGVTLGWSFFALRDAARDAGLLRGAYVPLLGSIGEALSGQNVMNTQLNHVTSAKNPSDVREWIDTARRLRPATLKRIRDDARAGLGHAPLGELVVSEADGLEVLLSDDRGKFEQLFRALAGGEGKAAEKLRDELVAQEAEGAQRLRSLRQRVEDEMNLLIEAAKRREARSVALLVGLSALTLAVGVLLSLYARRVLRPLSAVTARAAAVAQGDLGPRPILATDDEIGELASTFESMVAAIRKARSELVQAERLATIGKMAAHITHEVRNPLSSIGLNLELLEEELANGPAAPEAAQLLAAIKAEVERLAQIAEQYLAAARAPRLELELGDAAAVVHACLRFVAPELRRAGVTTRLEVEDDLPPVVLDAARLRQALLNLIRNAREAMPRGGELRLYLSRTAEGVALGVEDEGPGIPEEHRRTIFDPFFTTKERGTGLGLAVTRAVVEAHGGTIRCEPGREGRGTRFVLSLRSALPQEAHEERDGHEADHHEPERAEHEGEPQPPA